MANSKVPSLVDFAEQENLSRGPTCSICKLPDEFRVELEQAVRSGKASKAAAVRWLKANGFQWAAPHHVDHHFRSHVG